MIKIKICLANSIIKKKFFFIYNLNLFLFVIIYSFLSKYFLILIYNIFEMSLYCC